MLDGISYSSDNKYWLWKVTSDHLHYVIICYNISIKGCIHIKNSYCIEISVTK